MTAHWINCHSLARPVAAPDNGITEKNGILYAANGRMMAMRDADDDVHIVCDAGSIGRRYMEAVARMDCKLIKTGGLVAQLDALIEAGIVRDVCPDNEVPEDA